jgi:hypothetical protein
MAWRDSFNLRLQFTVDFSFVISFNIGMASRLTRDLAGLQQDACSHGNQKERHAVVICLLYPRNVNTVMTFMHEPCVSAVCFDYGSPCYSVYSRFPTYAVSRTVLKYDVFDIYIRFKG